MKAIVMKRQGSCGLAEAAEVPRMAARDSSKRGKEMRRTKAIKRAVLLAAGETL